MQTVTTSEFLLEPWLFIDEPPPWSKLSLEHILREGENHSTALTISSSTFLATLAARRKRFNAASCARQAFSQVEHAVFDVVRESERAGRRCHGEAPSQTNSATAAEKLTKEAAVAKSTMRTMRPGGPRACRTRPAARHRNRPPPPPSAAAPLAVLAVGSRGGERSWQWWCAARPRRR
jgi:hypothetical protein